MAQKPFPDSLIFDLHHVYEGVNWTNNLNWATDAPLEEWYGVVVANERVDKLLLPNNNLKGSDVNNAINGLTALTELNVSSNQIKGLGEMTQLSSLSRLKVNDNLLEALPTVGSSVLHTLNCQNNRLDFGDLEPFVGMVSNNFNYAPQNPQIPPDRVLRVRAGQDELVLNAASYFEGENNLYLWYKDGTPVAAGPDMDSILIFDDFDPSDAGEYQVEVTNLLLPNLTLMGPVITLEVVESSSGRSNMAITIERKLRLFPNPATTEINLDLGAIEPEQIKVYNLNGQQVISIDADVDELSQVDLTFLPPGLYYVYIIGQDQQVYRKEFVKMKN